MLNEPLMTTENGTNRPFNHLKIGVIGGGMAGSTIALRLAEQGFSVNLFEEGPGLVNGPPICHLHAGGNLYRDISDEQCLKLLKQSVDTLRVYKHSANIRPTVIAVPQQDPGHPDLLLPRLALLEQHYKELVQADPANAVLGNPDEYFRLYYRDDMERLAQREMPDQATAPDDWMVPVAKHLDLDHFKFPIVLVQEYGVSVFRLAATVTLGLDALPNSQVRTHTKVTHIEQDSQTRKWQITYRCSESDNGDMGSQTVDVDYLINACGYRTGTVDDMAHYKRKRMVEFKAAYVTRWDDSKAEWPEIIFHGQRGTPQGMAQLTPYPDGYFQLHGMTEDITLFKGGLVSSNEQSAQPDLHPVYKNMLRNGWQPSDIEQRTKRAIAHIAKHLPAYKTARVGGPPLFGAQQIPGENPSLRTADVSFDGYHYARTEIVKASSALTAADLIIQKLVDDGLISAEQGGLTLPLEARFPVTQQLDSGTITRKAESLAKARQFPVALALPVG
ncbi:FAD-dependent oxidoreductase [Photobacterium sp. TLY01]|uniref:FAD-dependent oxidoreductase n=1 Tax=Photobacterium sp. TLY01 TaxID=2907534 RepID=UPI00351D3A7C